MISTPLSKSKCAPEAVCLHESVPLLHQLPLLAQFFEELVFFKGQTKWLKTKSLLTWPDQIHPGAVVGVGCDGTSVDATSFVDIFHI